MKKLKLFLLIAGTLSMWQLKAQTGSSCSNAQLITNPTYSFIDTNTIDNCYWYKIKFNVLSASLTTSITSNNIDAMYLYSGNCSSLSLLKSDSTISSNLLSVSIEGIDTTSFYYLKICPTLGQSNVSYLLAFGTVPVLYWVNPDGSEQHCMNSAPFMCGMSICLGESLCFSFHYANGFTGSVPWDTFTFSGGYPNLLVPNFWSNSAPCAVFTPTASGTFTAGGGIIQPFTINVLPSAPPVLSFSISPSNPMCLGSCVEFTSLNAPSTIISYTFYAPTSSVIGAPGPVCTAFLTPGNNLVEYIVNAGHSCSATATYTAIVLEPVVNLVGSKDKCALMQDFTASLNCYPASFPPALYMWNIFNGSSSASPLLTTTYTPTGALNFTFPTTGTYYVEINITINGNTYTTGQVVIIGGITTLPSFVQGDGSCLNLCFNNTTKCYIKNITQWLWTATGSGGFSQTETSTDACFTFPAAGIYTICLQQDNNPPGGTDPAFIGVSCQTVSVFASTPIVITNTLLSLCNLPAGGLVTLNPNLSLGATGTVTWVASSGGTLLPIPFTTGINGIITYNLTGFSTYTAPIVFCVSTANNNCSSTQCVTIYPCCPTVTGTVVYNNTTFTTNTTLSGPTNYHFSGVITLSSGANLSIFGADVTFDPNAKIVVNTNSKLTSSLSYFHACGAMWDGVYLNNGSKLVIDQCTIEDSKRAFIDTLGATSISIENSWFNKNYESIILKATNTTQKLLVARNVFSCNNIPILYKTVPIATSAYFSETEASIGALPLTSTLPPYNALSYSGITLFQTKTPSNPSQYVQIDKYNLFDKLRFGIVATRSRIEVQKNTFQNIISPLAMPLHAGIYVYGSSGSSGIFGPVLDAKIGGTIPQANNFNNCAYGVFNQYAGSLTIRNNNFNYNSTAILITKNNKNKLVTIDRNKINETRVGVLCYDNVIINAQITENTLLNTSPVGAYNSNTGISTSEVIYSTLAKYNVYNNSITGYYNGLYATNTFSTQITDNEIHLIPSSGVGQYQFGIRYENTNSIKILNNNVDKPLADNSSWWQYGIFGNTNVTPYVYCNGVNNMYSSIKFQGPNITTVNGILGNVMNNGHFGIWLDVSAEIGDQLIGFPGGFLFASDNQWNGFSAVNPQTFSSGTSNNALFAKMYTKNSGGGSYYLDNANALNIIGSTLLTGIYTFPSLSLSCNSGIVTPALMQNANNVATSTMSFVTNVSNLNAISKRQLLHNIKLQNINITANPTLTSFVNSTFTNSIGEFYKVDSIINLSVITGSMSLLSSATLLNSAITSTSSIESNKKMLHATYINMFSAEPDSVTLVNLRTLAVKCPNDDGDAVFQARGILMYYDSKTYVSTCEEQATAPVLGASQRLSNATTTADENKDLSVYPNPTNKDITIQYVKGEDNEPAELVVYNQIGEIVLVKTLSDNKTEVNLSNLSSGIYLYTIKQQGLILKTNKLVITK